jgi:hypothetical protein
MGLIFSFIFPYPEATRRSCSVRDTTSAHTPWAKPGTGHNMSNLNAKSDHRRWEPGNRPPSAQQFSRPKALI